MTNNHHVELQGTFGFWTEKEVAFSGKYAKILITGSSHDSDFVSFCAVWKVVVLLKL